MSKPTNGYSVEFVTNLRKQILEAYLQDFPVGFTLYEIHDLVEKRLKTLLELANLSEQNLPTIQELRIKK